MKGVVNVVEWLRSRAMAFIAMGAALLLIGIDRYTKWLTVKNIELQHSVQGIKIGSFEIVNFTHIHNDGAAFGILSGHQTLLIVVTGLFLLFAIGVIFSGRIKSKFLTAAITLIIAGGIGNLIDRISLRYVIDFIELGFMDFAVFNFADICAVVGAFMLFASVVGEEIREYKARQACECETVESNNENES